MGLCGAEEVGIAEVGTDGMGKLICEDGIIMVGLSRQRTRRWKASTESEMMSLALSSLGRRLMVEQATVGCG